MKGRIKNIIKKNIPARFIELLFSKKVSITKIPNRKAVISDLFINRLENNWETYFEFLRTKHVLSPEIKNISENEATIYFFTSKGKFIISKEVKSSNNSMKNSLNISLMAKNLGISKDCLFAIFHKEPPKWYENYNSFLAERGYIGYVNLTKGSMKSFVHGNMDSIALDQKYNKFLLGETSFFKKEYHLQLKMEHDILYELFIVNSSNRVQQIDVFEKKEGSCREEKLVILPGGFEKFTKPIYKIKSNSKIILKSKLPLARPIVFKYMKSSFDVFHG